MLHIAICDDDKATAESHKNITENYLKDSGSIGKIETYITSDNLLYDITEDKRFFDLILLDIEMPGSTGMEIAEKIKPYLPNVKIIFITSHIEYAIDAFELSIFRYVPKTDIDKRLPTAIQDAFVWRYLFRYLNCHKNYLINTAVMWCVALILPHFLGKMENLFVVPIGFAILSINTPICILLSCDPDLEQAIRFLPGQKKAFCMPYCLFIFFCNMAANVIFLCSWQVKNNSVTVLMILTAVFFALQSAILSVLLEWFCPIRDWKIESDLWHHPRKYVVPAIMLLTASLLF